MIEVYKGGTRIRIINLHESLPRYDTIPTFLADHSAQVDRSVIDKATANRFVHVTGSIANPSESVYNNLSIDVVNQNLSEVLSPLEADLAHSYVPLLEDLATSFPSVDIYDGATHPPRLLTKDAVCYGTNNVYRGTERFLNFNATGKNELYALQRSQFKFQEQLNPFSKTSRRTTLQEAFNELSNQMYLKEGVLVKLNAPPSVLKLESVTDLLLPNGVTLASIMASFFSQFNCSFTIEELPPAANPKFVVRVVYNLNLESFFSSSIDTKIYSFKRNNLYTAPQLNDYSSVILSIPLDVSINIFDSVKLEVSWSAYKSLFNSFNPEYSNRQLDIVRIPLLVMGATHHISSRERVTTLTTTNSLRYRISPRREMIQARARSILINQEGL